MCQIGPKSLVLLILWNQRAGRRDSRVLCAAWLKVSSLVDSGRRTMASILIKRRKYGFLKDIEGGKDNRRVRRKATVPGRRGPAYLPKQRHPDE